MENMDLLLRRVQFQSNIRADGNVLRSEEDMRRDVETSSSSS